MIEIKYTIEEVVKKFLEPFEMDELEVRVGATIPAQNKGMALAYVDNRAIQNRLDDAVGSFNWQNQFASGPNGGTICGISIRHPENPSEWVTKWDGAENSNQSAVKGGLSDSMKRAGYQWGIGRYLYRLDSPWVAIKKAGNSWKIVNELEAKKKIISKQSFAQPDYDESAVAGKTGKTTEKKAAPKGRPFAAKTLKANMVTASKKEANVNGKATLNDVLTLAKTITGKDSGQLILSKIFGGAEFTQGQLQAVHNWLNAGSNDETMKGVIIAEGRNLFAK